MNEAMLLQQLKELQAVGRTQLYEQRQMLYMAATEHLQRLLSDPRYADPRRLERFGYKVYSQNDEDGILHEILNRIGCTSRRFIEFGVQTGIENNTLFLLYQGWHGLWLEAESKHAAYIRESFRPVISSGALTVMEASVTPNNINALFTQAGFAGEVDVLSIDIDGNDYYVFDALNVTNPRIVVIEYNAKFPPPVIWRVPYDLNYRWDGSDYFGASLSAFVKLFTAKGYRLVACNITGVNAFFVREDLLGDRFLPPYTAEHYYQPQRYYLSYAMTGMGGHPSRFGKFINE